MLAPSFLVPRLTHNGIKVWDTLAIAEYLHELFPQAGLLPKDLVARTHCRSVSGEMHLRLCQPALGAADDLKATTRASRSGPRPRPISSASPAIWRE